MEVFFIKGTNINDNSGRWFRISPIGKCLRIKKKSAFRPKLQFRALFRHADPPRFGGD